MMISRTLPINGEIEVNFSWDPGGPGLRAGWGGDDTGAIVKAGPLQIHFIFDVEERTPVAEWALDEIQVCVRDADGHLVMLVDEFSTDPETGPVRPPLSTVPEVCAAVEAAWEQVQAREALDAAKEEYWLIDPRVEPEASREAEARMRRLNAEYNARYPQTD